MNRRKVTSADRELLEELGVDTTPEKTTKRTPRQERIIAGFEEIERFVEDNGREPMHGEGRDIFERLFAVRLERIRQSEECREVLKPLDKHGLLTLKSSGEETQDEELSDEELLASLGVDKERENDVTKLKHVRPHREIRAAEEVAKRTPCKDFEDFKPLFAKAQEELETGVRMTSKYKDNAAVSEGDMFILDGQKVFVARMGREFINDYGRPDRRLRAIYDNGTESDILMRSLQRALNKDENSRRIIESDLPLFSQTEEDDDVQTGYIYVLRSKSEHPFIAENRAVIHKIGVTGGDVKARLANVKNDPTYLLADVEVIATFKLANISRKGFEALLHKFFANARLDLELKDRFDAPVKPREWFLVPLEVIEEAIEKIRQGTINRYRYDLESARIVPV